MFYETISVNSRKREDLIDVTTKLKKVLRKAEIKNGKMTVFIPHTTAAVTINENADPDVPRDIIHALGKIIPHNFGFKHREGNSDAHTKSSLVGCSQDILIRDSNLVLGTWQGIFFCEFDGPRSRNMHIAIFSD